MRRLVPLIVALAASGFNVGSSAAESTAAVASSVQVKMATVDTSRIFRESSYIVSESNKAKDIYDKALQKREEKGKELRKLESTIDYSKLSGKGNEQDKLLEKLDKEAKAAAEEDKKIEQKVQKQIEDATKLVLNIYNKSLKEYAEHQGITLILERGAIDQNSIAKAVLYSADDIPDITDEMLKRVNAEAK